MFFSDKNKFFIFGEDFEFFRANFVFLENKVGKFSVFKKGSIVLGYFKLNAS